MKKILLVLALLFSFSIIDAAAQAKNNPNLKVSEFRDGLAIITDPQTGKKGLINDNNKIITKAEYNYVEYLGHGYYKIIKSGKNRQKSGFIADGGKIQIKPQYANVWLAKKPSGQPKIVMTSFIGTRYWTFDNGKIVRDWSI